MLKDLLRRLRKDKGLNQIDLAQRVGVSIDSVRRWEAGKREPRLSELEKIALVLEVPVTSLVSGAEAGGFENKTAPSPKEERVEIIEHYGMNGSIKVPVYEDFMSACAGMGAVSVEGVVREELEIPVWLLGGQYSTEPGESPFIVRISGDSMEEAGIPDGCQVLVNPIAEADNGDVIIAELDGDWMVKWIYWNRHCDGGELRSASLKYPVKRFTKEDVETGRFRYIGKVCRGMTIPKKGE
ncbi:LexA family transcriptional regulator (plasmid) [Pyramidobacter sp. YE332]|uniref:LexA family protein n=1 Tax=Pyramidobacter sp. YE332 TaxID=3068894 RepID=UPI00294AEB98|nr:LexA family transcriptional regulator [Pyramidobacter sp. YE332]WOL39616.1 LexA family transcriptional regulator [Pyramidobacter sp. YE332]WOL41362.1 LexA family transcriptional regulator [Pyramidobacter sp. YE332]